jgi:hypothetical protein
MKEGGATAGVSIHTLSTPPPHLLRVPLGKEGKRERGKVEGPLASGKIGRGTQNNNNNKKQQ